MQLLLQLQCLQLVNFAALGFQRFIKDLQAFVEQVQLQLGKIRPQGVSGAAQHLHAGQQFGVLVAIGHQRGEQFKLVLGLEHRSMGTVQVVKMCNQVINTRLDIEGLQHVVAHKIGQVTNRLHRHRLVKQLQRLIAVNAKPAAKLGTVSLESIQQQRPALAQACAKRCGRGAKI